VRIRTVSRREPEWFDFEAPVAVSNADALHTYRDLLPPEHRDRWVLDRIEAMTPSHSCFMMHIGLRGMDPERLAAAEGYYWSCYDSQDAVRTAFKVFVPTHFDPKVAPPGCQALIVQKLTALRFSDVADWGAAKAAVEAEIMERLRGILPGIDRHIVVRLTASPHTLYRFTGNRDGAMLGWEMSPGQLGSARLPFVTPIRNLYLTGHWTHPGGGITPVIVSAQRAAKAILTGKDGQNDLATRYFAFHASSASAAEGVLT
jgi:prolycopene isomerase